MRCAHLTFTSAGRLPPFPDERSLRQAVRALGRSGARVVLFCVVDDHAHTVVLANGESFPWVGRSVVLAWKKVAQVDVRLAHVEPVRDRQHLKRLIPYMVRQVEHHGLSGHPALWTGSCFQDLVGARIVPGVTPRVRELVPRLRTETLLEAAGLPPSIPLLDDAALRALGPTRIAAAASSAFAAGPPLSGREAPVMGAKITAAVLAGQLGIATAEIAWSLSLSPRSARRLAACSASPQALRALRIRIALEEAVAASVTARAPASTW